MDWTGPGRLAGRSAVPDDVGAGRARSARTQPPPDRRTRTNHVKNTGTHARLCLTHTNAFLFYPEIMNNYEQLGTNGIGQAAGRSGRAAGDVM